MVWYPFSYRSANIDEGEVVAEIIESFGRAGKPHSPAVPGRLSGPSQSARTDSRLLVPSSSRILSLQSAESTPRYPGRSRSHNPGTLARLVHRLGDSGFHEKQKPSMAIGRNSRNKSCGPGQTCNACVDDYILFKSPRLAHAYANPSRPLQHLPFRQLR